MKASRLVAIIPAAVLAACMANSQPEAEQDLAERARAIQDSVITIDTHADIPGNFATATPFKRRCTEPMTRTSTPACACLSISRNMSSSLRRLW